MNTDNLHQIFDHYIERFDEINEKYEEFYKWQIANSFKESMDDALASSAEDFPKKLLIAKNLTKNVIDNFTRPFYGLCKSAENEPETVRQMFLDLFSSVDSDPSVKQLHINDFIKKSNELRDKYYPGSYLYTDDAHSVTGYLFLYNPDTNYLFYASRANNFADCIGFADDWGSMKNLKLDVFYKMCDAIRDEIEKYQRFEEVKAKRYDGRFGDNLHPDQNNHILVFDLIYCCTMVNLFDGIKFERRGRSKPNQELLLKQSKAKEYGEQLIELQKKMDLISDISRKLEKSLHVGDSITHSSYGDGTIEKINKGKITVRFSDNSNTFMIIPAFTNKILTLNNDTSLKEIEDNKDLLTQADEIRRKRDETNEKYQFFSAYL